MASESSVSLTPQPTSLRLPTLPQRPAATWRWTDGLFFLVLALGAGYAFQRYHSAMDIYEQAILVAFVPSWVWVTRSWRPLQTWTLICAALSLWAVTSYGGQIDAAGKSFLLKYLLSSQSAILWMCMLTFLSTISYWMGLLGRWPVASWTGAALAWVMLTMGMVGLMVRWYESYLLGDGVGHIPVSNLYEVFVIFALITTGFQLYYAERYQTRHLGGFIMLVVSTAVAFLLWYTFERQAQAIQPLLPALQSWWMKLHVPANFIGYGTFSLAAMVAFAYLIKLHAETTSWRKLLPLGLAGVLLCLEPLVFRGGKLSDFWAVHFGIACLIVAGILLMRRRIGPLLPSLVVLDDIQYKAIAVGFAFFTVATVLGALWAADAWGAYWQWDPKETWALIVWLNYAAWLHLRLMKGLRGEVAAYWSLAGLLITGFAFLGVNMFLTGLHSYGQL